MKWYVYSVLTLSLCTFPMHTQAKPPTSRPATQKSTPPTQTTTSFTLKTSDGFALRAKIHLPAGTTPSTLKRMVILIHGSGPNNMDLDLTKVTKGQKENKLFKYASHALVAKGFGVLRYNKRTYEVRQALIQRKPYAQKWLATVKANPLNSLIEDTKRFVRYTKKHYPKANIYLYGISQGTYIALQAAHEDKSIKGVALTGFYATPAFTTLTYVQTVNRPLHFLRPLDKNHDNQLDMKELQNGGTIGMQMGLQFAILDANNDGKISFMEVQGANIINYFRFQNKTVQAYNRQEATRPTVMDILKTSSFKVVFLQGMWDNQTPASHTRGIQLINQLKWKKSNFSFTFFPKLGHVLDPRDKYTDLYYSRMSPKTLHTVCSTLDKQFR